MIYNLNKNLIRKISLLTLNKSRAGLYIVCRSKTNIFYSFSFNKFSNRLCIDNCPNSFNRFHILKEFKLSRELIKNPKIIINPERLCLYKYKPGFYIGIKKNSEILRLIHKSRFNNLYEVDYFNGYSDIPIYTPEYCNYLILGSRLQEIKEGIELL